MTSISKTQADFVASLAVTIAVAIMRQQQQQRDMAAHDIIAQIVHHAVAQALDGRTVDCQGADPDAVVAGIAERAIVAALKDFETAPPS